MVRTKRVRTPAPGQTVVLPLKVQRDMTVRPGLVRKGKSSGRVVVNPDVEMEQPKGTEECVMP